MCEYHVWYMRTQQGSAVAETHQGQIIRVFIIALLSQYNNTKITLGVKSFQELISGCLLISGKNIILPNTTNISHVSLG